MRAIRLTVLLREASTTKYSIFILALASAFALSSCTKNGSKSPEVIEEGEEAVTGKDKDDKKKKKKPGAPGEPTGPSSNQQLPPPTSPNSSDKRYKSYDQAALGEYNIQRVQAWVTAHRTANTAASQNLRYTYIPFEMAADNKTLNQARVGLWKAVNHVSTNPKLYIGADASEGHGLVWAIDITALWGGEGQRKWNTIAGGRGKNGIISTRQNEASFNATEPVGADRLVYNMLAPNIYNVLIDTPGREYELRRQINAKNDKLWWAGQNEAIVFGPRVSWALETEDRRIYWATGDEFDGNEQKKQLIYLQEGVDARPRFRSQREHMLSINNRNETVASEAWAQKTNCSTADSNCFINYYIWGNAAQERGRAERSFVVDPGNPVNRFRIQGLEGGVLLTGRSCIHCHVKGAHAAPSDMARAAENPNSGLSPEKIAQIRSSWASTNELNQLYKRVNDGFAQSMRHIVMQVSDAEPALNEEMILGNGEELCNKLLVRCDERKCAGGNGGGGNGGRGLFGGLFGGG